MMTPRSLARALLPARDRKYSNKRTVKDGISFHSKREADRYVQLKLLEITGRIRNLELQKKYRCEVNGVLICTYAADFVYEEKVKDQWSKVVEDSKGYANDRWPMKKRLMVACHGIKIKET